MKIFLINKLNGLAGVWQTMYVIKNLVENSVLNREIKDFATSIVKDINPVDKKAQLQRIYSYLKPRYKYISDYNGHEEVSAPLNMLKYLKEKGYFYGDCDDATTFVLSLTKALGFDSYMEVIGTKPNLYNHIRPYVIANGERITLDLVGNSYFNKTTKSTMKPLLLKV
ncbi:MAG: hypothetical protein GYA62_04165 [Bacteroidales bacterium]|nr:hypothetical protein [Bacteroidales bacterium]